MGNKEDLPRISRIQFEGVEDYDFGERRSVMVLFAAVLPAGGELYVRLARAVDDKTFVEIHAAIEESGFEIVDRSKYYFRGLRT